MTDAPEIREARASCDHAAVTSVMLVIACLIALAGLFVILTGCASTPGSVQGVGIADADSGYDTGLGITVDAVTRGRLAVATRATLANATKRHADTGYTYSGSIGARYGSRYFIETGEIWYGYESTFADGTIWAKDRNTWYAATGVRLVRWSGILRYFPSNGDNYQVREWAFESRHTFGRWLITLEPTVYGITVAGERRTGTGVKAGIGWVW